MEKEKEQTEIIEGFVEETSKEFIKLPEFDSSKWNPRTKIGKLVKEGVVNDINYIIDNDIKILESEIIDALIPNLEVDLLFIGQSKGKFGGGQKRVFKQTQKKTKEGNKPNFSTMAVVGNKNGFIGVGMGKSRETVPAREKAIRNAKLNLMRIRRGCGDWACGCKQAHSIPYKVSGKCSSVEITLLPAPKGKGLIVSKDIAKILSLAGINDVWSKSEGKTSTKTNVIKALIKALSALSTTKIGANDKSNLGIVDGGKKNE